MFQEKRIVVFLILDILLSVLILSPYRKTKEDQLTYFNANYADPAIAKIYKKDKATVIDSMLTWGDYAGSPIAKGYTFFWVDTILYDATGSRLLALVGVMSADTTSDHCNLIAGTRQPDGSLNLFVPENSVQNVVKAGLKDKVSLAGRKAVISNGYYFAFTINEREAFWDDLFQEDAIQNHSKLFAEWRAKNKLNIYDNTITATEAGE